MYNVIADGLSISDSKSEESQDCIRDATRIAASYACHLDSPPVRIEMKVATRMAQIVIMCDQKAWIASFLIHTSIAEIEG